MCENNASCDYAKAFEAILERAEEIVGKVASSPEYEDAIQREGVRVTLVKLGEYYLLRSNANGKLFNLSSSFEKANDDFNLIEANKD